MAEQRLIEANAFARWLDKNHYVDKVTGKCDERQNRVIGIVISAVKNPEICPTVDAETVRHGRWERDNTRRKSYRRLCTACGKVAYHCGENCDYNYCPNCGAKMDGGAEDDDT